ncbi:MAG: bis(5'-nucleosyl)-tetraphosphatase [Parachlamydiales bacterium]
MEESFGIIPLRKAQQWETYLVHHQKGHWGFPKGHAEPGETPKQSAIRELLEETGLRVERFLSDTPLYDHYIYEKGEKRVTYFLAEVSGEARLQQAEIQQGEWLTLPEAKKRLTFEGSKEICQKVADLLS